MTTEETIRSYFRTIVLADLVAKLHRKDYEHAMAVLDDMYHSLVRLENEMVLDYYKGSYFHSVMKKLRNDLYYAVGDLEHNIDEDD